MAATVPAQRRGGGTAGGGGRHGGRAGRTNGGSDGGHNDDVKRNDLLLASLVNDLSFWEASPSNRHRHHNRRHHLPSIPERQHQRQQEQEQQQPRQRTPAFSLLSNSSAGLRQHRQLGGSDGRGDRHHHDDDGRGGGYHHPSSDSLALSSEDEEATTLSSSALSRSSSSEDSGGHDGIGGGERQRRRRSGDARGQERQQQHHRDDGDDRRRHHHQQHDDHHHHHGGGNNSGYNYCSSDSSSAGASAATTNWKTATDPMTGRTYYYDSVTRQTQWEKPDEIRELERRARKQKRKYDRQFFNDVDRNIRASLKRGEVIPGIPIKETAKQGPPLEPMNRGDLAAAAAAVAAAAQSPLKPRIRTISAMNEQLLAELQQPQPSQQQNGGATSAAVYNGHHQSNAAAAHNHHQPPSSTVHQEGRPPLMPPRQQQQAKPGIDPNASGSQDSMDLSPDNVEPKRQPSSADDLRGEKLLDAPILEASLPTSDLKNHDPQRQQQQQQQLQHIRRNTGGTIYMQSTMENPDVDATIKCVCGVYRAHIVQAATRKTQLSPVSVFTVVSDRDRQLHNNVDLDIFYDDYDTDRRHHNGDRRGRDNNKDWPVPTLSEIEVFYHDFFRRSQMEIDTIIMSLIYVERLIKETNGALAPAPHNWRSVLFSCMVLSSKVWDDLSMFNLDFSNVSMASGLSSFSLQRTNALELAVLHILNFCVKVPASEYAKYYFLIRTMLIRSGLLEGAEVVPPRGKDYQVLETRTRQYQDSKLNGQHERRARSVDWSVFGQETEPVLKDTVCLEQLVSMNR